MGIEAAIAVKDSRKTYIEDEDLIKRSKVLLSPVSNTTVTICVDTVHYFKGKESDVVILDYKFVSFFDGKFGTNTSMT